MRVRCSVLLVLTCAAFADLAAQKGRPGQACLTVLDQRGQHPIPGAILTTVSSGVPRTSLRTDSTGRACLTGRDTVAFRVDALGFLPVDLALATAGQPPVRLFALPEDAVEPEWAQAQLRLALAESAREVATAQDTVGQAVLAAVLRRTDSLPPEVAVSRDSSGLVLVSYVDLSSDGSYTSEVRLRYSAARSLVLGLTTRHCNDSCVREFDMALSWRPRDGAGLIADQVARKEAGGEAVVLALGQPVQMSATPRDATTPQASPPSRTMSVRGVVRDAQGQSLAGIEIYSADGSATALTNEDGQYQLTVPMPPGGVLMTTRRIGWAPEFRTVRASEGDSITWSPTLRSTTVLARRLVTAAGVPEQLQSPRYADFNARRARGVGQFFVTDEIWRAMSLGDVLNRARGFNVSFTYGSEIRSIYVPNCQVGKIGVYVDGIEQTDGVIRTQGNRAPQGRPESERDAEKVLPQFVTSAIVGMELYRYRTEIPAEFAKPYYCAVIAMWTR